MFLLALWLALYLLSNLQRELATVPAMPVGIPFALGRKGIGHGNQTLFRLNAP